MSDPVSLIRQLLLQDEDLIKNSMETVHLMDGEPLFHRGDVGDAFYLIESGHIRVFTMDQAGEEITLNTLSSGETLGEMALVDAGPRSASAIAVGACVLLRLNRADFLQRVHQSPALTQCIIELLSARTRYATEYVERLGHWSRMIIDGRYTQVIQDVGQVDMQGDRALSAAAESVKAMVKAVQEREETLRQEVSQLRIEIDQEKRKQQVDELTNSETFQSLLQSVKQKRQSHSS